ncbi:MAG: hypothetical protein ACC648_08075 [Thiohalobacterales bacterium]
MTAGMFSFDQLQFRYEPFPIGMARPLMDADLYREFVSEFPDVDMFGDLSVVGSKYSLSEKTNRRNYHELVHTRPVWKELHQWIKSDAFIKDVLQALEERHLELGYKMLSPGRRVARRISKLAKGHFRSTRGRLGARFEYSMLPVDGGHVLPHTDSPGKIITIIVSILDKNEWDPAFGGGTDLNRPRNPEYSFNRLNRQGRFEDMEVIDTFDFQPNQAVMFVRTFNSWHSVRPMQGTGSSAMRRSLTINIEERH